MKRGEVYDASLGFTEGSEQRGTRPVVIISRDAINEASPVVVIVPFTRYRGQSIYPSQAFLRAPEAGLERDSVATAEQVRAIDKGWLGRLRGALSPESVQELDQALLIALDLPGQT